MANATSYTKTGTKSDSTVRLEASIFGLEASHELVGRAYRAYLSNGRTATPTTLERGEVRGGGRKPWRQKGTGRARVGSIRVPNWRGGGVVFGPTGLENHTVTMPVRVKRLAIRHALSLKAAAKGIAVIEDFPAGDGRTKTAAALLGKLGLEGHIVLVVSEKTDTLRRATRNLSGLELVSARYLNVFTIINADHIVITKDALENVKAWLGDK